MPKVSVCVPVYNAEQYIARCLDSIQSQELKDIEIIVVNDYSLDKSMDIVNAYSKTDKRIKIIEHEANYGLMVARNNAYMAATGDYITFLDSDDSLAKDALENLYSAAIRENADIVSGVIQYVTIHGESYLWPNILQYGTDKISVYKSLLKDECGHNLASRLFRRELLQSYNYHTLEMATNGEDCMLFYQVVNNTEKIIAIPNIVYIYYQHMASSSNSRLKDNALKSIVRANRIRLETAGQYPVLKKLTFNKVSAIFWRLKNQGYCIDSYYIAEGLGNFCTIGSIIKYQGLLAFLKFVIGKAIKRL